MCRVARHLRLSVRTRRPERLGLIAVAILLLNGCLVGPKYRPPTAVVPPAYQASRDWMPAQPSDTALRGKWWEVYGDPQLNVLERQIEVSNQTLKAASARFFRARALVRFARADYLPIIVAAPSASRTRASRHRPQGGATAGTTYNDYVLPIDASYEPDVWGQVRHSVEGARANAQASAADLESVRLALHAELALDYFQGRSLESEEELLKSTVAAYKKALNLTEDRHRGGLASEVDVAQARTQLEATRGQAIDVEVQSDQVEHAIAVLIGKAASEFHLPAVPLTGEPPRIPPGLPSQLLERRPDVAAAERRVAAANADRGVARSAYFPSVLLSASGGFESGALAALVNGPSSLWSLGAGVLQNVYDGGRRRAVSEETRATYDETVANYRQTVLTAIREVEDNLAALHILAQEAATEKAAVESAQLSLALSNNRYKGGLASYLEVVTAQSAALAAQRTAVDIQGRRMAASVLLMKALGGGWNRTLLPSLVHLRARLSAGTP
jgi:NodT family efflux transporter outer membrane factor (OMF) lipoprotein